jgi:FkbH-like protein
MATLSCPSADVQDGRGVSDTGPRDRVAPGLARALVGSRERLTRELYQVVADWERTAEMVAEGGVEFVLQAEKRPLVDYLRLRFETGDPLYEQLYIGEKLKQLHYEPLQGEARRRLRERVAMDEQRVFHDVLEAQLAPDEADALRGVLARVYAAVLAEGDRRARVLLVGDCLYLDVVTFAQPALAAEGITLEPTFLTSKNPVQLRREIAALDPTQYCAVFYSPFTYEFVPMLEPLHHLRTAVQAPWRAAAVGEEAFSQVAPTLSLLAGRFECPVIVHNTAQVARSDGSLRSTVRRLATGPGRRRLAHALNQRVAAAVAAANRETFDHVHLLDETSWVRVHGEPSLGRYLHAAEYQHPARLGCLLAETYTDVIAVVVDLMKKKLVVCDLDNTIWDGIIGEGAVRHRVDRQRALLALKEKGVVLAINSKNDRDKVHFDGGLLQEADFVHAEINWDSKVRNMKRIAESLNLKAKDFVFVDDRADERAMVSQGVPGVSVADATSPRTWRRLALWANLLEASESDRTEMYRQYHERSSAMTRSGDEDEGELLASLGLSVQTREAESADLKRVAELINRTNQFNLQGSRTTFAEVKEWHQDPAVTILLASAADRFGSNGTVCIAVVRRTADGVQVPVFVLSCRVFGYGIERAVMNHIKRTLARDGERLVARLVVTPHNGPCHDFLPQNGFAREGDAFVFRAGQEIEADPPWLTVDAPPAPPVRRVASAG